MYVPLFREKRDFDDFSARLDAMSGGNQGIVKEDEEIDPVYLNVVRGKIAEANESVRRMETCQLPDFDNAIKEEPPSGSAYSEDVFTFPYAVVKFEEEEEEEVLNVADPFEEV
ncbi:hypothetical protein TELCIR_09302 [Teladorsagia circumcincta]|uniref:Uncharacterized protein n=1 Tax=Teladorsagia circumcincta TaxID=45464 RepID=A0A2G9UF49_TELCI|nr:hypothetical protein TELCIR_09302 [Teladorsagia circumcincta]